MTLCFLCGLLFDLFGRCPRRVAARSRVGLPACGLTEREKVIDGWLEMKTWPQPEHSTSTIKIFDPQCITGNKTCDAPPEATMGTNVEPSPRPSPRGRGGHRLRYLRALLFNSFRSVTFRLPSDYHPVAVGFHHAAHDANYGESLARSGIPENDTANTGIDEEFSVFGTPPHVRCAPKKAHRRLSRPANGGRPIYESRMLVECTNRVIRTPCPSVVGMMKGPCYGNGRQCQN